MRYVVVECRGYTITTGTLGGKSPNLLSSFSVLDTAHAHREVASFYAPEARGDANRRRLALAECERLNVLDLRRPLASHERGALMRSAA